MPILLFIFLVFLPVFARADLAWTSAMVFTAADPSETHAVAQFTFTNTGGYPIRIMGARTACGCTAAVADDRPVAPGLTGTVNVSFKTLNRHGLYEEPIIVDTNDPKAKESTVTLRVLVQSAVEVLPTLLFWQPDEPLGPKVIRITVTDGFTVGAVSATCPDPALDIHLDALKPGADYKLTVTPKARHLKAAITVKPEVAGKSPHPLIVHIRVS